MSDQGFHPFKDPISTRPWEVVAAMLCGAFAVACFVALMKVPEVHNRNWRLIFGCVALLGAVVLGIPRSRPVTLRMLGAGTLVLVAFLGIEAARSDDGSDFLVWLLFIVHVAPIAMRLTMNAEAFPQDHTESTPHA